MPNSKTGDKALSYAEKKVRALELRREGKGFKRIADEIGWKSHASAYDAVMKALRDTMQEPADELRKLEAERLNELLAGLWSKAVAGDTWSVDRVLNIMERRAKLFGLDKQPERDLSREADAFLSGVHTVKALQGERDLSE